MLSDPLSSPSSDAQSFDEDDMYGSDPDVETISLRPLLQSPESESPAAEMDDPLVLVILLIETLLDCIENEQIMRLTDSLVIQPWAMTLSKARWQVLLLTCNYFIQDAEIITQFNRLNMSLNQFYAMLSALYVTVELHTLSTSSEEDGTASVMSSPQDDAAELEAQDMIDDDGN